MERFWLDEHFKHDYELVYTPHVAKLNLWEQSGHTGFYRENMFPSMELEEVDYQLKPMNCPSPQLPGLAHPLCGIGNGLPF